MKRKLNLLLTAVLTLGLFGAQPAFAAEAQLPPAIAETQATTAEETEETGERTEVEGAVEEMAPEDTEETTAEPVQEETEAEALLNVEPTDYIAVLMYHHFAIRDMGEGNGVVTTQDELREHISYFKEQGYRIISLEDLDRMMAKAEQQMAMKSGDHDPEMKLSRKYLCITMDDGYQSNYDIAFPIFKEFSVPASVFAATDNVTNNIGLQKFTWSQARDMTKNKMKVYNHTANHKALEEGQEAAYVESVAAAEATLEKELNGRRDMVSALAYPNGRYNETVQEELKELGISLMFTVDHGVINKNTSRTAIPRIAIDSGMTGADVIRKVEDAASKTFKAGDGA